MVGPMLVPWCSPPLRLSCKPECSRRGEGRRPQPMRVRRQALQGLRHIAAGGHRPCHLHLLVFCQPDGGITEIRLRLFDRGISSRAIGRREPPAAIQRPSARASSSTILTAASSRSCARRWPRDGYFLARIGRSSGADSVRALTPVAAGCSPSRLAKSKPGRRHIFTIFCLWDITDLARPRKTVARWHCSPAGEIALQRRGAASLISARTWRAPAGCAGQRSLRSYSRPAAPRNDTRVAGAVYVSDTSRVGSFTTLKDARTLTKVQALQPAKSHVTSS